MPTRSPAQAHRHGRRPGVLRLPGGSGHRVTPLRLPQPSPWLGLHLSVLLFGTAGLFARALPLLADQPGVRSHRHRRAGAGAGVAAGPGASRAAGFGWWLLATGPLLAIHWASFFHAIQLARWRSACSATPASRCFRYSSRSSLANGCAAANLSARRGEPRPGAAGAALVLRRHRCARPAVGPAVGRHLRRPHHGQPAPGRRGRCGGAGSCQNMVAALCLLPW